MNPGNHHNGSCSAIGPFARCFSPCAQTALATVLKGEQDSSGLPIRPIARSFLTPQQASPLGGASSPWDSIMFQVRAE